jgi:prolyl oligopeptidase
MHEICHNFVTFTLLCCGVWMGRTPLLAQSLDYPKTKKIDHSDTYFGTVISDPYHWLEDDNAPDTAAWVEAENRLTFDYLGKIPYRQQVIDRIKAVVDYPKYSAPFRKGENVFFYKNSGLQNQSVLYIQNGLAGTPEVLLDPNTFSADGTITLHDFQLSKDGRYAAYTISAIPGSDWEEVHVLDITTRKPLPDTLKWVKFSGMSWRGNGFYYSRFPQPEPGKELTSQNIHQTVYYHALGTLQEQDTLVYEDKEHPLRSLSVGTTEDERFAILYIRDNKKKGNALYFREESSSAKEFTPIVSEITEDRFGIVDNTGDKFLLETNKNAPNGKVVLYDPQHPEEKDWKPLLPEKPEPLNGLSTVGDKLIASYLKDVTTEVEVYSRDGKLENPVTLPAPGTAYGFGGEKSDTDTFYVFTSLNYPATIFRYDLQARKTTLFHAPDIRNFQPDAYETKQVFYKSKDGTRIPMFLVYKKGLKLDGSNPTLLYGYGGFNITLTPGFSPTRIAWLEQGGVYAQMNLRGGGEYGEKWHEAGMRLNKQNVFDDCFAAAEWLIAHKYTSQGKLAIMGGSNGGLLVGAVINQRPDLFKAAIPQVGVMDMLRFQKFTAGAAWVSDYGSSDDETQFKYLLKYSPLHNIREGVKYPATLITTSNHDDRVVPAHSFKYAATLQEKHGGDAPILIRIETNSGHSASNLTKALEETGDIYSFLFYNLGITPQYK